MGSAPLPLLLCLLAVSGPAFAAEEKTAPPQEQKLPALFHKLSPSLVTNVQGSAAYIRCDVQLMTKGEENLQQIALHDPALRHELLLLLGEQQSDQVKTQKGKEKLRKSALKAVNGVLGRMDCSDCVNDLYFTGFFVQ